jgi:hypothetical protein
MNLACPTCRAPFLANDVHPDLGVANCRNCRGVLDLRKQARPQSIKPRRFTVDESHGYAVSWSWFHWLAVVQLVVAPLWVIGFVYAGHHDVRQTMAPPLPYLFLLAGLASVYTGLVNTFNRSRLHVDSVGTLTSTHGPLPWRRSRRLERHQIRQLFCRRHVQKSSVSFSLAAVDNSGNRITLAGGLPQLDDAKWLEARLEERLGLDNAPVEGEAA